MNTDLHEKEYRIRSRMSKWKRGLPERRDLCHQRHVRVTFQGEEEYRKWYIDFILVHCLHRFAVRFISRPFIEIDIG